MARYLGSSCKLCRREKTKLFLKAEKCVSNCVLDGGKRKNPPGQHGQKGGKKPTEYARHLREKQKARYISGLLENSFKNHFRIAEKMKGVTHENLIRLLEMRLDNVIVRLGFGQSRKFARQLVNHGNVFVNDRIIKAPGYVVKPGNKIYLNKKLLDNIFVKKSLEKSTTNLPQWLSFDRTNYTGQVLRAPTPEEFTYPIDASLIVELYSK